MPIALSPVSLSRPTSAEPGQGIEVALPFARSFAFGDFVLRPERQSLTRGAMPVRIGGRALDLLTALVERPGELIDKRDLVMRAWPSTFVDAANLKVNMASLRKALDESHAKPRYIATVVGRGYRFIAPVRSTSLVPGPPLDPGSATAPQIAGLVDALDGIRRELQRLGVAPPPEARAIAR